MGKNIPNSDDMIEVKISRGIEMRSGRIIVSMVGWALLSLFMDSFII